MWDGQLYATRDDACRAEKTYQNNNFDVRLIEQEGKFFIYTRRTVKEGAVTQS